MEFARLCSTPLMISILYVSDSVRKESSTFPNRKTDGFPIGRQDLSQWEYKRVPNRNAKPSPMRKGKHRQQEVETQPGGVGYAALKESS